MSHPDAFDPAPRGRWTGGSAVSILLGLALLMTISSPLLAQAPAPAPPAAPAPAVTRSLTLEYIIVVVMIGAALFAICRSSRRN
ncbi:hypothetical protein AYO47_07920 [Planctomyces sp. SCGC AG-212-M04]|nr:hypothetical protein AYO47_07920 [Planctomyces sp. SCGC AG-212-M04]